MKNLTNEQRDMLAECLFYARMDGAIMLAEDFEGEQNIGAFAKSHLALARFLETVGIKMDREDMDLMAQYEASE